MLKKTGIAFVVLGAVLILSALLLFFYNRYEDEQAGQEAESRFDAVESIISNRAAKEPIPPDAGSQERIPDPSDSDLPVVELEGDGYVGYLEIPSLQLKLPIMAEWDYNRLEIAPCRQFGSSRTDTFVIAAHNYKNHFGRLGELEVGETVSFTDMDGIVNSYGVEVINILNATDVDAVQNSEYDLVLYTCTVGGKTRVTVFCNRKHR